MGLGTCGQDSSSSSPLAGAKRESKEFSLAGVKNSSKKAGGAGSEGGE